MKNPEDDLLRVFGIILAVASTGAMVFTLQDLVTGILAKTLACFAGMALQGCLYLFSNHKNYRIRAFSGLLLILSVLISTWYIEKTWQEQNAITQQQRISDIQHDTTSSYRYQQQQQQIRDLNKQITLSLDSASQDTKNGYRDRGLKTIASVSTLKEQRTHLLDTLSTQQQPAVTETDSTFQQYPLMRLGLFALIALIIDAAAMIALKPVDDNSTAKIKPGKLPRLEAPVPVPLPVLGSDEKYQEVVMAIRQGTVPPSKNQVRKQLNVGAGKVADYFQMMMQEEILFQDDRGWYQLAI